MLILFHCTCLIANKLFEKINKHFEIKKREQFIKEIRERKFKFSPAAFRQRYLEVYYILTDERWRCKISTLCDFGCGEMGFYHQMRSFPLTSFSLIDIDEETLRKYASHLVPCPYENIDRIRHDPFVVSVYVGSVADPSYRFKSVHVITSIELVEHLYPDCLEAFPYTIFGFYTPLIVIVTTPNADFNVLFFDHPEILRHYDHKFEWTREQFEDWSNNIVTRFPDYTVFFSGAGNGPSGTEFLGKCTQIGIFVRRDVLEGDYTIEANRNRCDSSHIHSSTCKCTCTACNIYSFGICTYYSKSTIPPIYNNNNKEHFKQIFEKPFPYTQDFRPLEEKMFVEFRQKLLSISKLHYNERRNKCIVPVYNIKSGYYGDSVREEDIVRILKKNGYEIEESIEYTEYYVVLDPMEESEDSSSDVWEEEEQQKFPFWYEHHGSGFIDVNRVESEAEKEESDQIKPDTQSKVPNMAEESKMNPQADFQEEIDVFEESSSTPSLSSQDNKLHLKKGQTFERRSLIYPPVEINKTKLDINRINELDRFRNITSGRNFLKRLLKPQTEKLRKTFLRDIDVAAAAAGPSAVPAKKRKKSSAIILKDSFSTLDDMKSVTNCIIENTLNLINVDDVIGCTNADVSPDDVSEGFRNFHEYMDFDNGSVIDVRRKEGRKKDITFDNNNIYNYNMRITPSSYPVQDPTNPDSTNIPAGNRDNAPDTVQDNENNPENQNTEAAESLSNSIAQASSEAIVDPNSVLDLLDDFGQREDINGLVGLGNFVLVGIHQVPDDFENNNGFPDWLLNILGNQVGIEEALPINELDEAHFYCQGDGLGVHPSILAVEVDGDEEDDEESSDSTNNTEDFAEVDPLISSHDVSSLQEDVTDTQVVSEDTTQSTNIVTTNQQQSSDVESTSNLSDSGI
ncbi:uncharacterized protein LOC130895130 isoform X2 [Diorhabda carinulata]|uniref:uncharacterized protein LOC130895130 isoform X2 n=1 Tax=Diorhabda carinulata TaxID=1163345 RepID=UPI0025A106B5|nr:uncharacterized protein LOC130895130 isoform X2 [Diorhabda carinulata]XP_057658269.1 uncharacterized protein LOC130895130 isoform X2 [Diorhabda carinulata]